MERQITLHLRCGKLAPDDPGVIARAGGRSGNHKSSM
jgi:hypothetical protein